MELDDTWVLQAFEHCNFTLGCLLLHRVLQAIFLIDLDRILLLVAFVETQPHCRVGALADHAPNVV